MKRQRKRILTNKYFDQNGKAYFDEKTVFYSTDSTHIEVDSNKCSNLQYFCDEEGIKYGNKHFDCMIIPKEVVIEAFNKYIS